MKLHKLLALALLGTLLVLTPAATAFPPDPTWLSGFWDNDDYDDVIIAVLSSVGTVNIFPIHGDLPVPCLAGLLRLSNEESLSLPTVALDLTRAPPSA